VFFDGGELELVAGIENRELFDINSPLLEGDKPSLPCPRHPEKRMIEREVAGTRVRLLRTFVTDDKEPQPLRIDQCEHCGGIWFDGGELEALAQSLRESRMAPFLVDPQIRERKVSGWLWPFMMLTGLPVESWQPRLRRPYCMWMLVALCCLGFLTQLFSPDPEALVRFYGLVPADLRMQRLMPLVTYMFLHGGVAHLLGNLYFLWVFGDNVEDRLGSSRFLLLYLLAGIGAAACHAGLTGRTDIPVVGASGAIAGVMGAYAVLFPRARLVSLIVFFQVRWKTSTYLLMWLGVQLLGGMLGTPGIAWWAHVGGFLVGGLLAWPYRRGVARG
jgi:membrane associated rhomboid family serine protease